jgi:hypothetical protein
LFTNDEQSTDNARIAELEGSVEGLTKELAETRKIAEMALKNMDVSATLWINTTAQAVQGLKYALQEPSSDSTEKHEERHFT